MALFRDTHFILQKVQTHKTRIVVYEKLKRNHVDYSEIPNIFLRDFKCEYFAKGTEKSKIHGN